MVSQNEMERAGPASLPKTALLTGAALVSFYAALVMVSTGLFFAGGSMAQPGALLLLLPPAACAAAYLLLGHFSLRLSRTWLAAGLLALLLVFAASTLLSTYLLDISWDGRDYHQKAIYRLAQGWNPLQTTLEPQQVYYNVWLNHYPKGAWIGAAWFYRLTGEIESGKALNLIAIAAVFCLALAYFLELGRWRTWESALLALLLAGNPVALTQAFNFYLDGQVSSFFLITGLLLLLCLRQARLGRAGATALVALAASLVVGLNLKFTAAAYLGIACLLLLLPGLVRRGSLRRQVPIWAALVIGGLLGGLFAGYNPYLTNWTRYGHPFYPTFGENDYNLAYVISNQMPERFMQQSALRKLLVSVFSSSQNDHQRLAGPFKPPFRVSLAEVRIFRAADVRIGGWGPLFGTLLLLVLPGLFLVYRERSRPAQASLALLAVVSATLLPNPEAWWARYAPQLWLGAAVPLAALLACRGRAARLYAWLCLALALANLALVGAGAWGASLRESVRIRARLETLARQGAEVLVFYGPLDAVEHRLRSYGIPFQVVGAAEALPCPEELEPGVLVSLRRCAPAPAGAGGRALPRYSPAPPSAAVGYGPDRPAGAAPRPVSRRNPARPRPPARPGTAGSRPWR